jgi:diacylglycerol kinase (ATP)
MKKSVCFIVNPNAGRGKLGKSWGLVSSLIKQEYPSAVFQFTDGSGHAVELTREALKKGFSQIISCGGDGTLNECLNGFIKNDQSLNPEASLGLLPLGRGSDFARFLKFPRKPSEAVTHLIQSGARRIDVGKITCRGFNGKNISRYFLNIGSVGIPGNVDNWANKAPSFLPPVLSYYYCTVRGILEYSFEKVRYKAGGHEGEVILLFMIIANGRYFGSGMDMAPQASIQDGLFNISILPQQPLLKMLTKLSTLYNGEYLKAPGAIAFKAPRIEIKPAKNAKPLFVEMDGDCIGTLPATFEVLPRAIFFRG